MYNVKEYTFSSCTDIRAWEHKLTFVWLESCKRTVLNTKTHMRKEGGPGGGRHGWRTKETISNPRSGNGASSPLLSSPFAPCWRKPLHWSDSTHQRVWASSPERNASLFPRALDFRCTGKPSVHNACTGRARTHAKEGTSLNDIAAQGHTRPLRPPSSSNWHVLYHMYMHARLLSLQSTTRSLSGVVPSPHIYLKVRSQHLFLHIPSPSAIAWSLHALADSRSPRKGHSIIKRHARPPQLPAVPCKFSVVHPTALGKPPAQEHTQPPPKKKKKKKPHPSLSPGRVVCEFLLCCASFMPC